MKTAAEADTVVDELASRRGLSNPVAVAKARRQADKLLSELFPQQRTFVADKSKYKAGHPGRRAGKTYACAVYLLLVALVRPGSTCLYLALTRRIAKKLMWTELKRLNQRYSLGLTWNNADLMATTPGGAVIQLGGCEDASEVDKYRGDKYAIVIIDEAASFGAHFKELIEEALEPALLDLDGTLCMVGTPANHCTGPFYEACTDPKSEYSVHHWTILENIHLPKGEAWLERKCLAKGWTKENAIYLREYMGRWVRSTESVVYWYESPRNDYSELPEGDWEHVFGVDLGATDGIPKTAFTVAAFTEDSPNVYFRRSFKTQHMTPTEIANQLRKLVVEFGEPNRIVMDQGALGKSIAREITRRHGIPIEPAEKREKFDNIEFLNDDFRCGRVLLDPVECKDLTGEYARLQWDEDRKLEDKRHANHCADSGLYAYRECLHWLHRPEPPAGPEHGTKRYWQKAADKMEREAEERFREPDPTDDWWDN